MALFRRLLYAALCAGLVAGAVAAIAHQLGTVPLILQAETYEKAAQHAQPIAGAETPAWWRLRRPLPAPISVC